MEKIISPDNIEYQQYLSEISLFFKNKNDHENEIKKKSKKSKSSLYLDNISYIIDEKGDFIKENKNKGILLKIIKPKYTEIFTQINILEEEKDKYKTLLIRIRDEILLHNPDDKEKQGLFYEYQEKYNQINIQIQKLSDYFNQINNIVLVQEEINKLELEKDKYQENQRKTFSELKLLSSDTEDWKDLVRKYLSVDKDSDRIKLKEINEKILNLTKILVYQENEDDSQTKSMINPGHLSSIKIFAGDIGKDKSIIPRLPINFEITSLPLIEKGSEERKGKKIKNDSKLSRESILFNSRIKGFNFLSNFSNNSFKAVIYSFPHDSEIFEWPTVEHYFQAAKFSVDTDVNLEYIKEILKQKTPALAKRVGSNRKPSNGAKIREDWVSDTEETLDDITLKIKDLAMMEGISQKFSQNEDIKSRLIDTYPKLLIEKSLSDNYWGSGRSGDGLNMLGKIIMNYRDIDLLQGDKIVSSGKIILKRKKQIKKTDKLESSDGEISSDKDIKSDESSGGSILKLKGTKKNKINITWGKEDSLGNKLNDSNYELDKNIESIDLNNLNLDFMDSENDNVIIPGSEKQDHILSDNKENIQEIDLNNVLSKDLDIIDIKNLNIDNNEEFKVNNNFISESIDSENNIKNIKIKTNIKGDNKTSYFSDIETKDDNINLVNLMDNTLNNEQNVINSSNLKNIKIKL